MFPFTTSDVILIVSLSLAFFGVISISAGILLLISRAAGQAIQIIANQTARIAQKGIADDIAGLVGNATSLIEALNRLVLTNAGIGIFLVLFGLGLLLAAFWVVNA